MQRVLKGNKKELTREQGEQLLRVLKARFEKNVNRHQGLEWAKLQARLGANADKLWSLSEMEQTGGEPDVVGHDKKTGEYIFYDCSTESPKDRRSLCYDPEALDSRKENKPRGSAMDMADAIGIELLTEEQYRGLQKLGEFDTKTSSWVKTPSAISDWLPVSRANFMFREIELDIEAAEFHTISFQLDGIPVAILLHFREPVVPVADDGNCDFRGFREDGVRFL